MILLNRLKRLRFASTVLWCIGVLLTANFVISANNFTWYWWIPIIVGSGGLQFVITEIESALFTGNIPLPWSEQATQRTKWIFISSITVLLFDVLLQLGGVGIFLRYIGDSTSGDILRDNFGMTEQAISIISIIFILLLALLAAVGSEVLKMYADFIEDRFRPKLTEIRSEANRPRIQEQIRPSHPQEQVQQPNRLQAAIDAAVNSNVDNLSLQKRNKK